jgi:hypothetical protein
VFIQGKCFKLADLDTLDAFHKWLLNIDRVFEYIHALELDNYDPTLPDAGFLHFVSLCKNLRSLTLKTPSLPKTAETSTGSWPSEYIASLANVERFHLLSNLTMLQCFEWVQPVGLFELVDMRISAETRIRELWRRKVSVSVAPLKGVSVYAAYGGFTKYLDMWHATLTAVKLESGKVSNADPRWD